MAEPQFRFSVPAAPQHPAEFVEVVQRYTSIFNGEYAAQLLWQRGIRNIEQLPGFLNPDFYQPASAYAFGQEMHWAVERLRVACNTGEVVAIWGDFDADGITSTALLWEGLGQFFPQEWQLIYTIPNRLTESHGLNCRGINELRSQGCRLIVTCDTGSTNQHEIEYARSLGIDVIVTDHHTLPPQRPPVTAIINPRYLPLDHPLYHLSGVAVAYKLVEALYKAMPEIPPQPLENLLDLVAIGLIADLVQLSGDCRYLAQLGIERLKQQPKSRSRPGVARLLELCQRNGDRPTDISFGLGPRINAISRIHGDATFCVELLTSHDEERTSKLALETELANIRRRALQKDLTQQVKQKLAQLDLSTTSVIVLEDPQWPVGVLGLVAGQIAQEYGRPTILLSSGDWGLSVAQEDSGERRAGEQGSRGAGGQGGRGAGENSRANSQFPVPHFPSLIAKGSARSVHNIDLYQLVKSQEHLLHRFGGHPFAAGLSLSVENIPLFTEAINQQLRQQLGVSADAMTPVIEVDLVVTVAELGKELFSELKLLEPCGMGNPVPKLLIQNCWFESVKNYNPQDAKGRKVQYIKTEFEILDDSTQMGFPGIWWGHYRDEVPKGRCDAIVELDYNNAKKRPEIRLIAVQSSVNTSSASPRTQFNWILDWRGAVEHEVVDSGTSGQGEEASTTLPISSSSHPLTVQECPTSWDELQVWFRRAIQSDRPLAIAYPPPSLLPPQQIWQQLVGIAKFLRRTGQSVALTQLQDKLDISDRTLQLGLDALSTLGFEVNHEDWSITISWHPTPSPTEQPSEAALAFLLAVAEEQFLRQYFYQVPLSTLQTMASQVRNE